MKTCFDTEAKAKSEMAYGVVTQNTEGNVSK